MYNWYEPVFTLSRFGRPVVTLGMYRYNQRNDNKGPKVQWLCCKKTSKGCKASVITFEQEVVKIKNQHNHL
ncbi:unnamed protein product [Euphydryas editha]|uniref:FLYWCH-type domain-containing protein n=1 Tax=Euphydryas editha TaxID=104508 RepID=A0AAU9TIX4_EUPED|nr:unnamed protein product [Euphydryas editha]